MGGNPAASPREGLPKSRPRGAGHARPRSVRPHSVAPVIGWWAGAARRRPSSGRRSRLVWTDRVHGTNCCGRAAPGTRAGLCSRLPPGRRRNREVGASMTKRPPSPRHYGGRVARGAAARAAVALAPGGVRLPGRAEPDPRHRDHRRRRRSAARPADPGSGLPPPEIGRDPLQDDDRGPRPPADPAGLGDGARRFARQLRLDLDPDADSGLLDPDQAAETLRRQAGALDAWRTNDRQRPRHPAGFAATHPVTSRSSSCPSRRG